MTGQADVRTQTGPAIGHADCAVLPQDGALLLVAQLLEGASPAQGIPNSPAVGRVDGLAPGTLHQRLVQIRLIAQGVGAPEECELRLGQQSHKGRAVEKGAQRIHKEVGVFAESQQPHALGIVQLFVQHPIQPGLFQRFHQKVNPVYFPKAKELHKKPPVREDHLPVQPAPLANVQCFTHL